MIVVGDGTGVQKATLFRATARPLNGLDLVGTSGLLPEASDGDGDNDAKAAGDLIIGRRKRLAAVRFMRGPSGYKR